MAMALSSSSQKLMQEIYDEFLLCKICFETYRNPKTLTCLHIFCTVCLEKHMEAEVERSYRYMLYSRSVTCPVCRKKTDLPSGGIRRLPDNFLVSNLIEIVSKRRGTGKLPQCEICKPMGYHSGKEAAAKCLECSKLLCSNCVELHKRTKVTRGHSLIDTQSEQSIGCKVHQDEVVRFYCEPCEICICVLCTFQEHKGHNVQSFTEGIQKYQNSLDTLVTSCKDRITCVKDHLDMIKTCESEIRKAEDQIRDATIESISAIRQSEKQQVEELYDIYGEDTIQFLKEKHVLQDILDNLMSSCSLTEIILKDKSIELLLLRREIQDKLEVLLQGRVQAPPENLQRHVSFTPGQIIFGNLVVDGESVQGENQLVAFRANSSDSGVQTNLDYGSGYLQTDDDKLGRRLEMSDSGSNTSPPDCHSITTMTDRVAFERTSVQTEHMPIVEKGISTQTADLWSQFTNTPRVHFVDRSTITTKTSVNDNQTETKGLIDFRTTICGPDLQPSQNMGTITDPPDMRSRATSTTVVQLADKKVATAKLISHDIGIDPVKINTHDFGVMTKGPLGVDKAIGTKTIVLSDMCTGGGSTNAIVRTSDASTDTIWKGIRRVRHKATMHELLYNTQETDTDTLVTKQDRASSPFLIDDDKESIATAKRKNLSTVAAIDAKRACTTETQTDLNLQSLLTDSDLIRSIKNTQGIDKQTMDRGTTMASFVRVTDIGTGTVHVRIIDRGVNAKRSGPTAETNTARVQLLDVDNDAVPKKFEDKGTTTGIVTTRNKETATSVTKMKEKGTEIYVQSVEKATYMIQPVILSTGTNTPMLFTSDKKSETDFEPNWSIDLSQVPSVGPPGTNTNAATNDPTTRTTADRDALRQAKLAQIIPGQSTLTKREREIDTGIKLQDAATSTQSIETKDKETDYDVVETSNRATMTFLLTSDIGVQKRPHTMTRATSMKKTRTIETGSESPTPVEENQPHQDRKAEKSTATFKVELKSTGVCTPFISLRDRESSPIRMAMSDRSTSMTGVNLTGSKEKTQPNVKVSSTSSIKVPLCDQGTLAVATTDTKATGTVNTKTKEKGSSTMATDTRDLGTGTAHVMYYEKETSTPRITTMHKNMATENIKTADKQTATTDVAAAYKGLFRQQSQSTITVSRGTCTTSASFTDRECSPIKDLNDNIKPDLVDTGTNPVRTIYISKGVGVCKADLLCPQDKFQRAGQGARPRVLPKNMPEEETEPKFELMATIQETNSSDDEPGSGSNSPQCRMNNRLRMFEKGSTTTHREKLWRTPQRLGNNCNSNINCKGDNDGGGCSTGTGCTTGTQYSSEIDQSTFSTTGSTQTSSIKCKVETGTSTPPVEMEDKAMCTESFSVDNKITECISKLRTVSQRLEAQTTSIVNAEGAAAAAGPIYSKADSYRRESVTTQSTFSPTLSGQMLSTQLRGATDEMGAEREGLAPLPALGGARKFGRRQVGSRLGDIEAACPPFLARRELHSIDTGMVGGGSTINGHSLNAAAISGGGSFDSGIGGSGFGSRSKARKQRLDITQLLSRPLGSSPIDGGMPLRTGGVPYRPSLSGLKIGSLDECTRNFHSDPAVRKLRAKMSAIESPEDEQPPTNSPLSGITAKSSTSLDSGKYSPTLKQRSERPRLENMLGSISSSSSSPSSSPKTDPRHQRQHQTPKVTQNQQIRPSPPSLRKSSKDRTNSKDRSSRASKSRSPPASKSRSPPVKRTEKVHQTIAERRESSSSDTKSGVCCGLGSPRTIHRSNTTTSTSLRNPRKSLKEVGRLQRTTSSSISTSSSSSNDDGRDSPADSISSTMAVRGRRSKREM